MGSAVTDAVADIVADVVATTRRGSLMYSRNRFHAPWGIAFPAGNLAIVHVVTAGTCRLAVDGASPVRLAGGDVALILSGAAHVLADTPGRPARPVSDVVGRTFYDIDESTRPAEPLMSDVVIEGDGPVTMSLCGGYRLANRVCHPLTGILPDVVIVTAAQAHGTGLSTAAAGAPRATLTRRFAALTGHSPMAYLTAWRMSLAARALRDGDATVRHIAHQAGYDSEFAFARAFKRATGSAPGQYRKHTQRL
jgi:AraC-like DNA-binding protein